LYSRVSNTDPTLEYIDLNAVVTQVTENLRDDIEKSGAVIEADPLPVIVGSRHQMVQLFQNLLSNALKFRGKEPPRVKVSANSGDGAWCFAVQDNGIGISSEYFDQIFVIFRRLHKRGDYPGSGIGLAICKKVVESHGGRIWLESQPGSGSTFHFTLSRVKELVSADVN
jgi:light-regulated signal transduction histidine kinase (bacteriophytochrome)